MSLNKGKQKSSRHVLTERAGKSTGIERIYAPTGREDPRLGHTRTGLGRGFGHKTCKHRMRAGWIAPSRHISYGASVYRIRWKKVMSEMGFAQNKGNGCLPLNHEMAAIVHRIANAARPVAGIAMTIGVGSGQVGVGQGSGRVIRVMRWVDIKVAMESRRGRADVGKGSSSGKTSTVATTSRRPGAPSAVFEDLSKCMCGIPTVILFAGERLRGNATPGICSVRM
jgi:hypothetical protein